MNERRRFIYCVGAALALHSAGVTLRRSHRDVEPPVVPALAPLVVPVSIEEPPAEAPAPPPPAPVAAPQPLAPVPATRPPAPLENGAERPAVRPRPAAPRRATGAAEDASAFGGTRGAFRANVCYVPKHLKSALLVDGCKTVAAFLTNEINVSPRRFLRGFPGVERRVEWFGIDYKGRFKVRAPGYFTFRLVSDDGAVLFIDGAAVLDNDGEHSARSVKMALPLTRGEHEFRLLYYQGPGDRLALQLFVKAFQSAERPFGPEL